MRARKGGVDIFIETSWEAFRNIDKINSLLEFDEWHNQYSDMVISQITKTSRGKNISYGQAQKPINVFLKVFIDWMNKPNLDTANKIRNYLHVPIDSVVIDFTKYHHPQIYKKHNLRKESLSKINENTYIRWQECFRELSPIKPLLIARA